MSNNFPKGSEWRKWDLHVHTPGTQKNDQYKVDQGDPWELFCQKIHDSDVQAIGICDYFSTANYFTFIGKYQTLYPDSTKAFFLNIEVCTSDVVNNAHEEVNVHLIFNPEIPDLATKMSEFLSKLKTNKTNTSGRHILASELSSSQDYQEATTTREFIKNAFEETFGVKVEMEDYLIIITAANNDGIRTGTEEVDGTRRGIKRKAVITDELDKFSHAFFGSSGNVDYFSDEDRLETDEKISPKPVFSGSDSHSFDDLDNFLGKQFTDADGNLAKQITWVKADPTYEGLKQTLYEPLSGERVYLGTFPPDRKSPDRVIRKIIFENTIDFPNEILFNDNLSSIIGSRSSGKSALLAYIAYAVDPNIAKEAKPEGPAAKISWEDVTLAGKIEWGNGLTQQGKVVYIPQNYLYRLSRKPEEITGMIAPVLFERHPDIEQTYKKLQIDIRNTYNKLIEETVNDWLAKKRRVAVFEQEAKDVGDKEAINKVIGTLEEKIEELKKTASLSDEDIKLYTELSQKVHQKRNRIKNIEEDFKKLTPFLIKDEQPGDFNAINFTARTSFEPSIESLPDSLQQEVSIALPQWSALVSKELQNKIVEYQKKTSEEKLTLATEVDGLIENNRDLIDRCKQNEQLQDLIEKLDKQKGKKAEIEKLEAKIVEEQKLLQDLSTQVKTNIDARLAALDQLREQFNNLDQTTENIQFGVEVNFDPKEYEKLSGKFNKREGSVYIENTERLKVEVIRENPLEFMEAVNSKKQKVLSDQNQLQCLIDALTFVEEVRFKATMEGDTIGGFSESSMTEGKQALFALTLLLNKESDTWPLLIDQPEDDLDSRSIYGQIVPYLREQKKRRQIIMVSHNANLVVGADSEQVIVANQHGNDRKNTNDQKFNYTSGSLEFTQERNGNDIVLQSCGIREHACDILDGGKTAFEKRKHKYNI